MRCDRSIVIGLCFALSHLAAAADAPGLTPRTVTARDDSTFRPTVIVSRGINQGSGTVIASIPGETLVLTAAHVMESPEAAFVEVHRYNLGLENKRGSEGWPKKIPAKVVAIDPASDVAIMRISGFQSMPYVARLSGLASEPEPATPVLSVGIDRGTKLTSWSTRVIELALIDMKKGGGDRPFLLTDVPPEHGRSGGGLYNAQGQVVGVCVGRVEVIRGQRFGIFSSSESVRRILVENGLDLNVARSVLRRTQRKPVVERTRTTTTSPSPARPEKPAESGNQAR